MANKTFHIPKSAIVETEDNVSILEGKQQTITTDASAVATLTNTDGFKAAHYSIAAERDGEVTTTTTTTTTTVTGSGSGLDADTKLLLNANYIYDESFSKRDITLGNTEVVRRGYAFDGTDDYISAPASSDFDFGTGAFTIEFWFKANQTNSFERFVSFGTSSSPFYYYTLAYQPSGQKYEFVVYNGGSWESTGRLLQADASDIEAGVWTHLALVRESGDSDPKLYINGVERSFTAHASSQSMPSLSFSSQSGALLKIGSFQGSVDALSGYMSDIRISKGNARYTADFDELATTKDDDHVLILTGETTDQSDSSHTLTFSGAHPTAKYGQGSFYFDGGSSSFITIPKDSSMSYANKSFAMEAWVMLEDYPSSYGAIFGDSKPSNGIEVALTSTGYIFGWIGNGSWITNSNNQSYNPGGSAPTLGGPQLSKGTWYHIAITFDGSAYRLFVDGALSQTYTTTTSTYWGTDTALNIGTIRSNGSYVIKGYVSDFRLSVGTARYTAAFTAPTAPLETEDSRTKLLLNTNSALQDFEIGRMALAPTYAGDTKVIRRGYAFDGSNDYILVSGGTSAFAPGNGDFTIEFSLNANSTSGSPALLSSLGNYQSGFSGGWAVSLDSNSKINIWTDLGGHTSKVKYFNDLAISSNEWYNLAIVRTNTNTFKLYRDGALVSTAGDWNQTNGTTQFNYPLKSIGRYQPDNSSNLTSYFDGYITDIRLTEESLYTSDYTPAETLTAGTNTKFLLTGGETEESDVGHTLAFQNDAHPTAKFGDGAYYFDGSDKISIEAPSSDFDWSPTDKSWTWELWYNVNSGQQGGLIGTATSISDTGGWDLYLGNGNNISAYGGDGSNIDYILTATSGKTYTAEEWRHIAVSYDQPNNKLRFFNDGTMFQETTGASFAPSTGKTLNIGDVAQDNQAYKGYIDDVRVTIGQARYTASFDVPTSELGSGTGTTTSTETTTTTTTGSSDVVLTKVHLVHDGSNVYFTEYGRTATDDDFLELSASYDAGVAKLHASTTSGSATLELTKKEFDFSTD